MTPRATAVYGFVHKRLGTRPIGAFLIQNHHFQMLGGPPSHVLMPQNHAPTPLPESRVPTSIGYDWPSFVMVFFHRSPFAISPFAISAVQGMARNQVLSVLNFVVKTNPPGLS